MTINLVDPAWVAVFLTVAGGLVTLTHFITKALSERQNTTKKADESLLSEEQLMALIYVHEDSIASEVMKIISLFIYRSDAKKISITEERIKQIRNEIEVLLKKRRERLRVFRTPIQRLDRYPAEIYDRRFESDYDVIKTIALSKISAFEKVERINKEIERIQIELCSQADEDLRKLFAPMQKKS